MEGVPTIAQFGHMSLLATSAPLQIGSLQPGHLKRIYSKVFIGELFQLIQFRVERHFSVWFRKCLVYGNGGGGIPKSYSSAILVRRKKIPIQLTLSLKSSFETILLNCFTTRSSRALCQAIERKCNHCLKIRIASLSSSIHGSFFSILRCSFGGGMI